MIETAFAVVIMLSGAGFYQWITGRDPGVPLIKINRSVKQAKMLSPDVVHEIKMLSEARDVAYTNYKENIRGEWYSLAARDLKESKSLTQEINRLQNKYYVNYSHTNGDRYVIGSGQGN